MTEVQAPASRQMLNFASRAPGYGAAGPAASLLFVAALMLFDWKSLPFEPIGSIAILVFFATFLCIPFVMICERWIVEVDPTTRRLTIFRLFSVQWTAIVVRTTVVADCSFDECSWIGTTKHRDDNGTSYNVSLEFKRGGTHEIPVQDGLFSEATKRARQLADATGIPLDGTVIAES